MRRTRTELPWRPTHALVRSIVVGGLALLVGLVLQRPDLVVLGLPFAIVAIWSSVVRPRESASAQVVLADSTVVEGGSTQVIGLVDDVPGIESVTIRVAEGPRVHLKPRSGIRAAVVSSEATAAGEETGERQWEVAIPARVLRWGQMRLGPAMLGASSPWGAWRCGPRQLDALPLTVLPETARFDVAAPRPHPQGLVGLNRSRKPGEGSEFASVRPFASGDRLRRIHWTRTSREGSLQVRATHADLDTHVMLVLDAHREISPSGGVDGQANNLDVAVRAAVAVAEQMLRQGERVSLRVVGSARDIWTTPSSSRSAWVRLRSELARVTPAPPAAAKEAVGARQLRQAGAVRAGTLVVVFSDLTSESILNQIATLHQRGLSVVVLDCLVGTPPDQSPAESLGWRLRLIERERHLSFLNNKGVPVVRWAGPGTLDTVLLEMARRSARAGVGR